MKSEYWYSLAGGAVIGLACTAYLFLLGRVAGISGMIGRVVSGRNIWPDAAFLAGLAAGPVVWSHATGDWPELSLSTPWYVLLPAGFLVGYGTRLGSGCTSGHGVMGLARLSPRSMVARPVSLHAKMRILSMPMSTLYMLISKFIYRIATFRAIQPIFMSLRNAAAFVCGLAFSVGLLLSGMANPATVRAFLDLAGDWNPSLVFVLGGAVTVAFAGLRLQKRLARPVLETSFQLPTARQIDAPLVAGSCLFGVGWGLSGFCPGPAVLSVFVGQWPSLVFVLGLLLGVATYEGGKRKRPQ
ncbi:hypothetical protein KL928_004690 [Ogataea angusta]|uniref:YeeE/YedE family protein n=1 Tax=Pichia angusta TaxID=870730 RepID=A0AAN6DC89_PICAN|nr:uncharacterized protein KL928_004690 [Ogataea angusta]KAG7816648.1 hypothetical protein KL928_004690 [Ogataea angusta]